MRKAKDIYGGKRPRDLPFYSVAEAARIVRVPAGTLRTWVLGRPYPTSGGKKQWPPLIRAADPKAKRVSFANLVELHVLSVLRGKKVRVDRIRSATAFIRKEMGTEHPFADVDAAIGRTPRMEVAAAQAEAARAGWRASQAGLVPQVGALAHWARDEGVGELAASKELYAGIGLDWDIWSWGRKRAELAEAEARLRQAEAGLSGQREAAILQAEAALKQADLAEAAWRTAGVSTSQAEENLRIEQAKFEAHTSTSADLLQAETLLTKAQADRVASVTDYLLAVAKAQDALGLPVAPFSGVQEPR